MRKFVTCLLAPLFVLALLAIGIIHLVMRAFGSPHGLMDSPEEKQWHE
jgi:hypothetical protein